MTHVRIKNKTRKIKTNPKTKLNKLAITSNCNSNCNCPMRTHNVTFLISMYYLLCKLLVQSKTKHTPSRTITVTHTSTIFTHTYTVTHIPMQNDL